MSTAGLRQLVEAFAETLQRHREANALFRRLEDDEGRGLGGAELAEQLVVHDDLGDAAIGQAADEAGAADVLAPVTQNDTTVGDDPAPTVVPKADSAAPEAGELTPADVEVSADDARKLVSRVGSVSVERPRY